MAGYGLDENGNIVALGRQPGLLDDLANYAPGYEYGTILPYRINQKTKQREFAAPSIIKDMARAITAPERAYYGLLNDPQQQAMEANNFGLNLLGSGVGTSAAVAPVKGAGTVGHTVWHGSPHKFDKFDMSKIGTGEGAQAYGHGLYFAESPEVATEYKKALSGLNPLVNGEKMDNADFDFQNGVRSIWSMMKSGRSFDEAKSLAVNDLARLGYKHQIDALNRLKSLKDGDISMPGQLYKVDIPDEILPRMLDWDKPLSQQAPEVQKAFSQYTVANIPKEGLDMGGGRIFSNMNGEIKPDSIAPYVLKSGDSMFDISQKDVDRMLGGDTGEAAYTRLTALLGGQTPASYMLGKQGIPGIRYLDGNSRGAGNGSYNYVIFDDTLPRILERNGIPTGQQPWPSLLK